MMACHPSPHLRGRKDKQIELIRPGRTRTVQILTGMTHNSLNDIFFCAVGGKTSVVITYCPDKQICQLKNLGLMRMDVLDIADYLLSKIINIIAQDIPQHRNFSGAPGIFYVQVYIISVIPLQNVSEHIKVHFVIEGIMTSHIKVIMIQLRLVIDHKTSEVQ
jgi:intracellular septation protein A